MPIVNASVSPLGAILELYVHVTVHKLASIAAANLPIPSPVLVRGLIDSGASGTCLDLTVIRQLGLQPTGSVPVHTASTAGAPQLRYQFDVALWLAPQPGAKPHNIRLTIPVIEADLAGQGIELLIGRNVLDQCLFVYDGPSSRVTLAFP